MTLREALAAARLRLVNAEFAGRDAEVLLLYATGLSRTALLAYPDREVSEIDLVHYSELVERRLKSEPIQYILGEQEFYGLALRVTPAVLIPRPETEHLVEAVLARLPTDRPVRILDVGTGSGAIAIALAVHLPQASVTAVDLSSAALEIARENAARHGLSARIRFLQSDLLATVQGESFDAIVSNPPYIPSGDQASLHPQVREYEPEMALFAGETGLTIYERLIPETLNALQPGGLLALEMGWGQRDALAHLLAQWNDVSFVDDLQGIPRVALATKPA